MDFEEYIYSRKASRNIEPIEQIRLAMDGLEKTGRIEGRGMLKTIHIVGTNGKGSTASFINHILMEAGYRVGLFTSPHIEKINDRIRINNDFISDKDFQTYLDELKPLVENLDSQGIHLSFFTLLTLISYLYFIDKKVDFVIYEAGIGGSYDATNVFENKILSLMTNIGLDHVDILGDTIYEIAKNKAGIIQDGASVVSYSSDSQALKAIKEVARAKKADLEILDPADITNISRESFSSNYSYRDIDNINLSLLGDYQVKNSSLAILAINKLKEKGFIDINNRQIREGIGKTFWRGRMEVVSKKPLIILDGAHNVLGVEALISSLKHLDYKKLTLVFGIVKDKDYKNISKQLSQLDANFILTQVNNKDRKLDMHQVEKYFQTKDYQIIESNRRLVDYILSKDDPEEVIVVTGSLFLISDIRRLLEERR